MKWGIKSTSQLIKRLVPLRHKSQDQFSPMVRIWSRANIEHILDEWSLENPRNPKTGSAPASPIHSISIIVQNRKWKFRLEIKSYFIFFCQTRYLLAQIKIILTLTGRFGKIRKKFSSSSKKEFQLLYRSYSQFYFSSLADHYNLN